MESRIQRSVIDQQDVFRCSLDRGSDSVAVLRAEKRTPELRQTDTTWSKGCTPAQAGAIAALDDKEWLHRSLELNARGMRRLPVKVDGGRRSATGAWVNVD